MRFMYAAYALTWVIHLAYLLVLASGFKKVRREFEDLNRQ